MKRLGYYSVAALVSFGAVSLASAQEQRYRAFDHGEMMGWGGWFFGPIMMVTFFALLVGAVVLIVRILDTGARGTGADQGDRARAILRERFAKGEISKEEYEAAAKVLD